MKRHDKARILELTEKDVPNAAERKRLIGAEVTVRNIYVDKGEDYYSICVLVDGEKVNKVLSNVMLKKIE